MPDPDLIRILESISGWQWSLIGTILAIFLAIIGMWYTRTAGRNTDKNVNIKIKSLENLITKAVVNERSISSFFDKDDFSYEQIIKEAKSLLLSHSNYQRGLSRAVLGDLIGAESEFSTAINQQLPILTNYYYQRGNIRYLQEKYAEACKDYDKATQLDQKNVLAWNNKAASLINSDRYAEALEASERTIELDSKYPIAWDNKASSLNFLGRFEESLEASEIAIRLDPTNETAWVIKSSSLGNLDRHEEALKASETAIQLDSKDAMAWYNKAFALNMLGEYNLALDASEKAIELDSKDALSWNLKASILGNLSRSDESVKASGKADKSR